MEREDIIELVAEILGDSLELQESMLNRRPHAIAEAIQCKCFLLLSAYEITGHEIKVMEDLYKQKLKKKGYRNETY